MPTMTPTRSLLVALCSGLVACVSSAPREATVGTPNAEAPRDGLAAFVVVTELETVVVPVDPSAPVIRAGGMWILDESDARVLRPSPSPESRGRPACMSTGAPGECSVNFPFVLEGDLEAELDAACACFTSDETEHCADDPFVDLGLSAWEATSGVTWDAMLARRRAAASDGDEGDDEYSDTYEDEDDDCSETSSEVVSLHAGVLYSEVFEHNGCGGMNLYGVASMTSALTNDAIALTLSDGDDLGCDPDGAFLDGWATPLEETDFLHRDGHWMVPDDRLDDAYALERCDGFAMPDGEVAFNRGADILMVGADVDGTGGGARFSASLPADRAHCTSADPCGSRAEFASLIAADPSAAVFVSNDAHAALRWVAPEAALFMPSHDTPFRGVGANGDLLGIRYHTDARRLVRAMQLEAAHHAPEAALCAPGLEQVDGECAARCEQDLDCRALGSCQAVCREGVCLDDAVDCAETHPCGAAEVCERSQCRAIELAAADANFHDARGGTGWGNRCIEHLRTGALDAAQAACAEGLGMATRAATRGALLYNLGLVAERRHEPWLARLYYEASLVARPNATVARALATAGGPVEP